MACGMCTVCNEFPCAFEHTNQPHIEMLSIYPRCMLIDFFFPYVLRVLHRCMQIGLSANGAGDEPQDMNNSATNGGGQGSGGDDIEVNVYVYS